MNMLQKMESDFKAEVIATQWLSYEQDVAKFVIERLGNIPRTHTKDVYHSYTDISQVNLDSYTVLQSFRQSIYEAVPENVFHPPTLGGLGKTQEEILEEIKHQRKKENEARTFFKPFEQEAPYLEMQALMLELMFEKKATYDNLYKLFEQGWPVISRLPYDTALSFIYILPILNEVRGKRQWIEKCLTFLTGFPVSIRESYTQETVAKNNGGFVTGVSYLGVNTTFSGALSDGECSWILTVGPVAEPVAGNILPQSGFENLLDVLLEYMAPSNLFIKKRILVMAEEPTMLTDDPASGRLGFTFNL